MRTFHNRRFILVVAVCLLPPGVLYSQDVGTTPPALPSADTGTLPVEPTMPIAEPTPLSADPVPPETAPPWTWQHQTQNQNGTVTNLHEQTRSQDGNAYSYQHSVTRPNGSHTQLREYSQTDEGYQLMQQQRFYKPDGTLLREHGATVTGTDPYNYQRQMTHTFRDGRTMENTVTRSYDGTTGTMTRSFLGPNGQVHQFERPWTPDEFVEAAPTADPTQLPTPEQVGLPTAGPTPTVPPQITDPHTPETAKPEKGFFSWLNPFQNRESKQTAGSSATAKRSGFTIGSFGSSRQLDTMPPGQARKASGLSDSPQMRSMKTRQSGPPAHASANLPGSAGKNH